MKTKIWIITALVAVLVAIALYNYLGTGATSSAPPIDRDAFVSLYVDLELIAEKAGIGTPQYETARDSILDAYGVTLDDVTVMLTTYDTEPEKWADIWDRILAELDQRKAALADPDSAESD